MTTEPIDFADLHARAGGDQSLAREILGDLVGIVERERPLLRDACRSRSFHDTARRVHRLRGSLLAVGAGWAARRALRVEETANQNSALDLDLAFTRFEAALDDAIEAIHEYLAVR